MLKNQVQLITYPDSLGGKLSDVARFLDEYVGEAVGGVHILPFYPSSADRGFAPLTHLEIDPEFGTWDDIKQIAEKYDLMADLTVNHISCESEYFKDFLINGDESPYAEMFLDINVFLARHGTEIESLSNTYRPKPNLPYTPFQFSDGSVRKIWTTFTNHQVDLDLQSDAAKQLMISFILKLVENGVDLIRLDAVGYTIKKPWTNSFLIPETYEFIKWVRNVTPQPVQLLAEIHHSHEMQQSLLDSHAVEWIYDFSLPLLVIHTLQTSDAKSLINWINIRSENHITTLDTHDGIGVIDVNGLMTEEEVNVAVNKIQMQGAHPSYRANGNNADNVDIYQINSTYYSAVGEDDDAYIVARAIQFFIPGIPQVYYVGLLAGMNDFEALEKTNHGRDINRHNYSWAEVIEAMRQPVVQRLLELMRFRNSHPAFAGEFSVTSYGVSDFTLRWDLGEQYCQVSIDLKMKTVELEHTEEENGVVKNQRC